MLVTDMIWTRGSRPAIRTLTGVELAERSQTDRAVLELVRKNAPQFSKYYSAPPLATGVHAIQHHGYLVGAVLLEAQPKAAETAHDGALGCLVVESHMNGQGIGSAAIVRCCERLAARGFRRVIAEWVASVPLYQRLGFVVWKQREIPNDAS